MSQNATTSLSGLIAMSCVLPILCIVAVGLRFWLRGRQKSQLKVDDWLMVPALVSLNSSWFQYQGQTMTTSKKLTLSLPIGFVHWHVHMRHSRYKWLIKILHPCTHFDVYRCPQTVLGVSNARSKRWSRGLRQQPNI